jgi:hypothetical protein
MGTSLNIHASCILLGRAGSVFQAPEDAGILLLGASGSGKSDLALRLIAAGAELVSDDRTELSVEADTLLAAAPPALAGLIEVRNLGIVALPHWPRVRVALAVDLGPDGTPVRLPETARWTPPGELALPEAGWPPLVRIDPFEPSAPVKVALAAAAFARGLLRDTLTAT